MALEFTFASYRLHLMRSEKRCSIDAKMLPLICPPLILSVLLLFGINYFAAYHHDMQLSKLSNSMLPEHCALNESDFGFLCDHNLSYPEQIRHPHPSFLFSFGGSGNTLTRLMLEYVTNIWTGTIYADPLLFRDGFKGEMEGCTRKEAGNETLGDSQVLLIKVHPEHLQDILVNPEIMQRECLL